MIDDKFDKCHCDSPGFCPLFNKVMTDNPPNWQWCQSLSEEQREKYYIENKKNCFDLDGSKVFVTNEMLVKDTIKLINDLPPIKAVIGCPRSGMMPASFIATALSIPLFSLSDSKLIKLSARSNDGGSRMRHHKSQINLPILVIDDTVFHGGEINLIKNLLKEQIPNEKLIFACVYCLPSSKHKIDYYSKGLTYPHILEWNIFNAESVINAAIDIDGVLCEDVPIQIDDDGEKYINYITNVKPIKKNIPKTFECKALCSGRLEKYRKITEEWLNKHGVKYKELYLYDKTKHERDSNHAFNVGKFKATITNNIKANLFIESCDHQSKIIANELRMINNRSPVLCINSKKIY